MHLAEALCFFAHRTLCWEAVYPYRWCEPCFCLLFATQLRYVWKRILKAVANCNAYRTLETVNQSLPNGTERNFTFLLFLSMSTAAALVTLFAAAKQYVELNIHDGGANQWRVEYETVVGLGLIKRLISLESPPKLIRLHSFAW